MTVDLDPVGVGVDDVTVEVGVLLDVGQLAGAQVVHDARADRVAEHVDGRAEAETKESNFESARRNSFEFMIIISG